MIDVSILVRCYEQTLFTERTLASIATTARTHYELICRPNPISAAANSNWLIKLASSNRIILLDDDLSFVRAGWDERLLDTLNRYPGVGCVSPRIMDPKGRLLGPYRYVRDGRVVTGFEVWGAALAFERAQMRYDETYVGTQCDDTDFLLQHLAAGYLLAIDGSVDVIHRRELSGPRPPWYEHNQQHLIKKWDLSNRFIAWGEYTEWYSPTRCKVGFPPELMPRG
ncbi:MAG: hypothetical protein AB1714_11300 [Acidobacteriota bacterium]